MDPVYAAIFNRRLEEVYGRIVDADKPLYRVVFSEDQIERRRGTFYFSEGGVALSEPITEIRVVPKYQYLDSCWILERLVPNILDDVMDGAYSYEPLFVFDEIEMTWPRIQQCIYNLVKRKNTKPPTIKEMEDAYEERLRKKKEEAKIALSDSNEIVSALHDGSAVSLAGVEVPKNE